MDISYKLSHLLHFRLNKELKEIYMSVAFRSMAFGLVGIFIPIYLYKLGYSFTDILLFYVYYHIACILFLFVASRIAKHVGVKHLMLISIFPLFVFFILLMLLNSYNISFIVHGLLFGFSTAFYWIGYHMEFTKFSDKIHRGREVGLTNIAASVLAIFAPTLGGLLIAFGGFISLFIGVLVVLILSVVPLFMSSDIFSRERVHFDRVFKGRKFRGDYLPYFLGGIFTVAFADIWPLILFLTVTAVYSSIGMVFSVAGFLVLIFTYIAGKIDDRNGNIPSILKIGGIVNGFVWFGRLFINGLTSLFFIESLAGVVRPFWFVPLDHYFYDRTAGKKNVLDHILFRETVIHFGSVVLFLALILLQNIFLTPVIVGVLGMLHAFI